MSKVTQIATLLPDNTNGDISPKDLRDAFDVIEPDNLATIDTIREFRHTVVMDTADHSKATKAEAITAFKQLPHFDFSKDDQFYIKDTTGKKMISMKYFADGATDEASVGRFYNRAMVECK